MNWEFLLSKAKSEEKYTLEMFNLNVHVVSLNRTKMRNRVTLSSLEAQEVTFKIFEAVDGLEELDEKAIEMYAGLKKRTRLALTAGWKRARLLQLYQDYASSKLYDEKLKSALHERLRFGCYVSHILLWRQMLHEKLPFIVVLEDDVELEHNFSVDLKRKLQLLPQSWGLVYLNGCYKKFGPKFSDGLLQSRGGLCTFGYVISSKAAEIFLNKAALKSNKPVDHMMDEEVLTGRILAFHSEPPLIHLVPNLNSTLAY